MAISGSRLAFALRVTRKTAPELIAERADYKKANMALTAWREAIAGSCPLSKIGQKIRQSFRQSLRFYAVGPSSTDECGGSERRARETRPARGQSGYFLSSILAASMAYSLMRSFSVS